MSKIGRKPIPVPESVEVKINNNQVLIKGPQGEMSFILVDGLKAELKDHTLFVLKKKESKRLNAFCGLYRQLLANAILGVVKKWEKRLVVVGTGYNVKLQGEDLVLKLGYSHPVIFKKPLGIEFKVEKNTVISVLGIDKQKVGEVAYQIRQIKPPDAYKGKGIRFEGEQLKLKPTKKVKAGSAA